MADYDYKLLKVQSEQVRALERIATSLENLVKIEKEKRFRDVGLASNIYTNIIKEEQNND